MMKAFSEYKNTYELTLSDGKRFGFASDDEKLRGWMDEFGDMVQMRGYGGAALDGVHVFSTVKTPRQNNHFRRFPGYANLLSSNYANFWYKPGSCFEVIVELDDDLLYEYGMHYTNMSHCLKIINKHYFENGGGVLHAAFAGLDGRGVLIAAPGNTGKTTSLSRLPGYWDKLSDDIVLMVLSGGKYRVHPMPTWSDYFIYHQKRPREVAFSLPLGAIFFLEQSGQDQVVPLKPKTAVPKIMENFKENLDRFIFIADTEERKRIHLLLLDTSIKLAGETPCFTLKATLQGRFWKEMEKTMKG